MFHMQRKRRLHEEEARFYSAEICLALNFLHEKGFCLSVCICVSVSCCLLVCLRVGARWFVIVGGQKMVNYGEGVPSLCCF